MKNAKRRADRLSPPFISTHDLTKRSTLLMMYQVGQCTFQLTTSRRGRRCNRCGRRVPTGISTHDLTKRSTTQKQQQQICRAFQLTTSRRGRRWISSPRLQQEHFNSRPHEEVDPVVAATCEIAVSFQLTTSRRGRPGARSYIFWCRVISTHDLTKRSTSTLLLRLQNRTISTHDLTKRSTPTVLEEQITAAFQLTTSRRGRPTKSCN